MTNSSFLFLGANRPWTYALAEALAESHYTHALHFYDWRTYYSLKPSWSQRTPPFLLKRTMKVFPSGYAGRLEKGFRFYLRSRIQDWCQELEQLSGEYPWVIAPEPYLYPWVSKVPSERLIYYNLDDYVLYRPDRKKQILDQEQQLIKRAILSLCLSQFQVKTLKTRYPHQASRIYHFPLGLVESFLNPQPENLVEPMTVGYVGSLGDRLDWKLISQVIQGCPDVTFVFVGGLDEQTMINQGNWQATRQTVLTSPNVRHIGKVPSDKVANYYWSFAISWIPYLVNHPFNQASCPTKIMDSIASGRPIVSTSVPECCLYPEWIKILDSVEETISFIRQELDYSNKHEDHEKILKQLKFANQNTWQIRAKTLEQLLIQ